MAITLPIALGLGCACFLVSVYVSDMSNTVVIILQVLEYCLLGVTIFEVLILFSCGALYES